MEWKRCDIEGIRGIAVAAHKFKRPHWWQLWDWLVGFVRFLISGAYVHVVMPKLVAFRGFYIGYQSEGGVARRETEFLHHQEFLLIIGPKACKVFALDKDGDEVEVKSAGRGVSFKQSARQSFHRLPRV